LVESSGLALWIALRKAHQAAAAIRTVRALAPEVDRRRHILNATKEEINPARKQGNQYISDSDMDIHTCSFLNPA